MKAWGQRADDRPGAMTLQHIRGRPLQGSRFPIGHLCLEGAPGGHRHGARGPSGPVCAVQSGAQGRAGVRAWEAAGPCASSQGFLAAMAAAGGRTEAGNPGPPAWRSHTEPHADPTEPAGPRPEERARAATVAPLPGQTLLWLTPAWTSADTSRPLPSPDTGPLPAWGQATGTTSTEATSPRDHPTPSRLPHLRALLSSDKLG